MKIIVATVLCLVLIRILGLSRGIVVVLDVVAIVMIVAGIGFFDGLSGACRVCRIVDRLRRGEGNRLLFLFFLLFVFTDGSEFF